MPLPTDPRRWPHEWRVEMEERIAIRVIDGRQDEQTARREAEAEIRSRVDGERLTY